VPFALAQDPDALLHTKKAPAFDLNKVPEKYIAEAMAYGDECKANFNMTQYFNCECLSYEYLKSRVALGPIPNKDEILLSIDKKCRDSSLASGPLYLSCLKDANLMEPGTDPEAYCKCVANTYVKIMDREAPTINSHSMIRLQTQASLTCSDPALAQKLYHFKPE